MCWSPGNLRVIGKIRALESNQIRIKSQAYHLLDTDFEQVLL